MPHVPVLLKEVLYYLDPKPGDELIDCTLGDGGHSLAIFRKILPNGRILAIDLSQEAIERFKARSKKLKIEDKIILVQDNFKNLKKIALKHKFKKITGILLDLGLSTTLLEKSGRGFSFKRDEPLDMRYGKVQNALGPSRNGSRTKCKMQNNLTAGDIIDKWPEKELVRIFKEYGEERFAKPIAWGIIQERRFKPIKTTFELVSVIKKSIPKRYLRGSRHFATKTFQALRIAVNDELNNLREVLPQAVEILAFQGRIAVISFHSLEDRIVKIFFRRESKDCICPPEIPICRCNHKTALKIITKKPICPSEAERKSNPRSRSAKLRVAEKV